MSQTLDIAREQILAGRGLVDTDLERVLDRLLGHRVDQADIYFESSRLEAWTLEDGIVRDGSFSIEQGAGIRAISGEKTGFAYTDELTLPNLLQAAGTARSIARSGGNGTLPVRGHSGGSELYAPINPLPSLNGGSEN